MEGRKKYRDGNAQFLNPSVEPSVLIQICGQLNYANKVFFKTPFIDFLSYVRHFLISNDKFKKRRIGNSKTTEDKVCTFAFFYTSWFINFIFIMNFYCFILTYLILNFFLVYIFLTR